MRSNRGHGVWKGKERKKERKKGLARKKKSETEKGGTFGPCGEGGVLGSESE